MGSCFCSLKSCLFCDHYHIQFYTLRLLNRTCTPPPTTAFSNYPWDTPFVAIPSTLTKSSHVYCQNSLCIIHRLYAIEPISLSLSITWKHQILTFKRPVSNPHLSHRNTVPSFECVPPGLILECSTSLDEMNELTY